MVSINYWVEHQGSRSSMPDTGRVVPVIKSDRAGYLGVEFGGNELDVSYMDHVYCFDFWWEFFCPPVFGWRGSPSSSLGVSLPLCSAFNLSAGLKTQHSL